MAKTKISTGWLIFGIIGLLAIGGFIGWIISYNSGGSVGCSNEFQHITTGTFNSNGKCCVTNDRGMSLTAKAPSGFAGGAWCLSGQYDATCLIPTGNNGIDTEGIYAVERTQTGGNRILLNPMSCPRY